MLLTIHAVCPGTGWVPGQTVEATPEQATKWADGVHATVVRSRPTERADKRLSDTERRRRWLTT